MIRESETRKGETIRIFFPSWSQASTVLQFFNSFINVLLHMDQSKSRKGIQWEGGGTQCSVPAFTSHLLETELLMAMESSTGISTNKTLLFKHYYLLWLHANLMRQWDSQWRKSHNFAFVHKGLIQEGVKFTPSTRGWWISVYYINKGGLYFKNWLAFNFIFYLLLHGNYTVPTLYFSFLQWGHRNRIIECPDLERTYRDHLVLPLTLHRTTPRIPPCA